jgi:hypothetical protein
MTITADGQEPVTAQLDEITVKAFLTLATWLPDAPTPNESENEKATARRRAAIEAAEKADFEECGRKLKELHPYQQMLVFTFLDLATVDDHWQEITATAKVLLRQKKLTGQEVRRVICKTARRRTVARIRSAQHIPVRRVRQWQRGRILNAAASLA